MKSTSCLAGLVERFFTERLMRQRRVSPHTVESYRDTFRLLLRFAHSWLRKRPDKLELTDVDASLICAFLDDMEQSPRSVSARTRNLRLTAIRSFFRFVAFEEPMYSGLVQRVLAIPSKRADKRSVEYLTREEVEALLDVPDCSTWLGRRDHALLLLAVQTGLRLSELTGLNRNDVHLGRGAHVRCLGKGRKERCTPLTSHAAATTKEWLREPPRGDGLALFPRSDGGRLSADAVQYLLRKYIRLAVQKCPTLKRKRVSPHVLRHTAAMELLQAGVDCTVIALWLGHESVETTQAYLHAHLAIKEAALAKLPAARNAQPGRYHASGRLLAFLDSL
ncbi:site-specific recombinase XerD [Paraburkholderia tropica]|nr:site-specific recombinase XerD [Paraburkholderia tropica]